MLKINLHLHTSQSGHAFGSFYGVLEEASKKGMDMIAITDHGPAVFGSATETYFAIAERVPRKYKKVKVLFGCEANIIDKDGNLDLSKKTIKRLDILIVGIHDRSDYKDLNEKNNTLSLVRCFEKYKPNIFSHPPTMFFKYDIEKAVQAACDNNVLIELNLAGLGRLERKKQKEDIDLYKKMVAVVKKNKKRFIVNSDAHFLHEVGDDSILPKYMKKLGISEDMVLNNYPEELNKQIKRQNGERIESI